MDIELLLFGRFREIAGTTEQLISVKEGACLSDLMQQLAERYGADFGTELDRSRWLRILVNGREYTVLDGMETSLKPKDKVVIMPPIAGG